MIRKLIRRRLAKQGVFSGVFLAPTKMPTTDGVGLAWMHQGDEGPNPGARCGFYLHYGRAAWFFLLDRSDRAALRAEWDEIRRG